MRFRPSGIEESKFRTFIRDQPLSFTSLLTLSVTSRSSAINTVTKSFPYLIERFNTRTLLPVTACHQSHRDPGSIHQISEMIYSDNIIFFSKFFQVFYPPFISHISVISRKRISGFVRQEQDRADNLPPLAIHRAQLSVLRCPTVRHKSEYRR